LFSQDRGVILADATPPEATTPPTVIATAKSAAIAFRLMLSLAFFGAFAISAAYPSAVVGNLRCRKIFRC